MFLFPKVLDEVVADSDSAVGFEEKVMEPTFSLACCFIGGAAQTDLWTGSSAAMDVISVWETVCLCSGTHHKVHHQCYLCTAAELCRVCSE